MKKCTNCDFDFEGKFCSNCGQNAKVGNLNIHDLIHEFWHSITHTDKGILRLIKELFLRPKQVYLNYFSGQRKNYFSPVTFYLISATLLIYVGAKIFDYEDFVHRANNPNGFNEMGRFIFQETKFKSLLLMPFEIILTWLLFKKTYNFAKNIVFWLYLYGFLFTIKFIFTPFYFAFIFQKEVIDSIIGFLTLLVIFYHLYIVFGKTKKLFYSILICFMLVNFHNIIDTITSAYLIYGDQIFVQTHCSNIFELIMFTYRMN